MIVPSRDLAWTLWPDFVATEDDTVRATPLINGKTAHKKQATVLWNKPGNVPLENGWKMSGDHSETVGERRGKEEENVLTAVAEEVSCEQEQQPSIETVNVLGATEKKGNENKELDKPRAAKNSHGI